MTSSFVRSGLIGIAFLMAAGGVANAKAKEHPPKDVVSLESARKTAKDALPGQVQSEHLERENGQWVYSFDLKSASDSKVHELQVDARSGKLLTTNAESDDEKE